MQMNSLRLRLTVWFGALALTGVLAVGLYVGSIATGELKTLAGNRLAAAAHSASALLSVNLRERQLEIELLAQSPLFMDGNLQSEDIRNVLDARQAAHGSYAWVGVTNKDGQIQQATKGLLTGQDAAKRPWFKAGQAGNFFGDMHEAVMLAKLLPQSLDGQPLRFIDVASPVWARDGSLRGVLAAHMPWQWVTDTISAAVERALTGTKAEIILTDRSGSILYPYELIGTPPAPKLTSSGFQEIQWPDGAPYLTAAMVVDTGTSAGDLWTIIVRQPRADAIAPIQELTQKLLGLGLVVVVIFGLVAYRFASRLSRPIEDLARAANIIEQQDTLPSDFPQKTGPREIDQLNDAFRSMAESLLKREQDLSTLNTSLETLVDQRTEALAKANRELHRLATHDPLTGVLNRRQFDTVAAEQFAMFKETGKSFSIILVDADHFKAVNDTHGHQIGDKVLQTLAGLLMANIREGDTLARFGGEEFIILLPQTPALHEGKDLAERLCATIASAPFPGVGSMTVSLGVSQATLNDERIESIVERADTALYLAKRSGRNQAQLC